MESKMFCPKCGSADQTADSYCRQCGDWLPDLSAGAGGRFRSSTREQKVRRMRVLQMVSIGLSLGSAVVIINFLANGRDKEMLSIAALCSFLVAVYQIISLALGYKVLTPKRSDSVDSTAKAAELTATQYTPLKAADTQEFISPGSVVENTTTLLEPTAVVKSGNQEK